MADIVYTIYDGKYITVTYHPETKIIHHISHGAVPSSELREALNAGTNLLKRYAACKWLSDDRQNPGISPADVQYQIVDWVPRTVRAGWKYWAVLVPETLEGKADLMSVIHAGYDLGVHTKIFADLPEAYEWLAGL